jgi:hypothetical protein
VCRSHRQRAGEWAAICAHCTTLLQQCADRIGGDLYQPDSPWIRYSSIRISQAARRLMRRDLYQPHSLHMMMVRASGVHVAFRSQAAAGNRLAICTNRTAPAHDDGAPVC